jgi:hypothetical protein
MRTAITAVAATALVLVLGCAWFFRYERLAPVVYPGFTSIENPGARPTVVVCTTDRWTNLLSCERIRLDTPPAVQKWLRGY